MKGVTYHSLFMKVKMSDSTDFELPEVPELPEKRPSNSAGKVSPSQQGTTIPQGWRPTLAKPLPSVRCTGTIRNGERKGERCDAWSYAGATVCIKHGAALPPVQKAAEDRKAAARLQLLDASPEAAEQIMYLMKFATQENVRLAAAKDVLDRAGIKAGMELTVTHEHKLSPIDLITERLDSIASNILEEPDAEETSADSFTEDSEPDIINVEVVAEDNSEQEDNQINE
jgi:hypothetical protein